MAEYDYRAGKKRIEEILDNSMDIIEQSQLPADDSFTFSNGYYCWISAIFIDMRDSTHLCANEDKEELSKVFRCFSSELIEILRSDENLREIGIRGDCVYAVYTTPTKASVMEIADKCFWANTFIKMLNKMLRNRCLPEIKAGIGMSTSKELVIKAGRKGVGINSKIWIGKAVARACHYANRGNKGTMPALVFSECSYDNFINALVERNEDKKPKDWFTYYKDSGEGAVYVANIVKTEFDSWISEEV